MDAAVKTVLLAVAACSSSPRRAPRARRSTRRCETAGNATIVGVSGASCDDAPGRRGALAARHRREQRRACCAPPAGRPLRAPPPTAAARTTSSRSAAAPRCASAATAPAPDLDGWAAGRELLFARGRLVGGTPPPRGAVLCTSAFLDPARRPPRRPERRALRRHAQRRHDAPPQRRAAAPAAARASSLGRVQRNLARTRPLDALVLPVPSGSGPSVGGVVDRGVARPPWFVAGDGAAARRRRVCYTGRTSGVDQCGEIVGVERAAPSSCERVRRHARALHDDHARARATAAARSTRRRAADGTVYAVGITTLVVGLVQTMCFTPIEPVLDALDATLVTAAAG